MSDNDKPRKEIAYQLYDHTREGGLVPFLAAVTRSIDPATDDYKAYCRYIVGDLATRYAGFLVFIFDNAEAERLNFIISYERPLTDEEILKVDTHTICIFSKGMNMFGDNVLKYYSDCFDAPEYQYCEDEQFVV